MEISEDEVPKEPTKETTKEPAKKQTNDFDNLEKDEKNLGTRAKPKPTAKKKRTASRTTTKPVGADAKNTGRKKTIQSSKTAKGKAGGSK